MVATIAVACCRGASQGSEDAEVAAFAEMNGVRVRIVADIATSARLLHSDDEVSIVAQDFGPDGGSRAGVAVLHRRTGRWCEIVQVSTAGASFGRSPSIEEGPISVVWDYRHLADRESVAWPLMTSGSVNLPERVGLDGAWYVFRFNERGNPAYAMTEIRVARADLLGALGRVAGP